MNKKAVSLMVSYVLLTIMAIALSVFVYAYLKLYVPAEQRECPTDTNLAIDKIECSILNKKINVTLSNRGLFNISSVFLRIGPENKTVKYQINQGNETFSPPLAPQFSFKFISLQVPESISLTAEDNEIEAQPAVIIDKFLVPCKNSVTTLQFNCS